MAMPPNANQSQLKFVIPPKNPGGKTYFDWNKDEKLKKWRDGAIRMQETHVKDNNRTEWFSCKAADRDAIELRILVAIYGIRTPIGDRKGAPSCYIHTYTRAERLDARKLKKTIVKNSESPDDVQMNIIYISTATKVEEKDEYYASEEPVFVVKKDRKFIDKNGRTYANYEDYKTNNKLTKAAMIAPKDGNYTPKALVDGKVPLDAGETPATTLLKRIGAISDTVVMIAGMALAVTGVVTFFAPGVFSATVMNIIQTGSFFLTTYSTAGAVLGICDKTAHDESIRTEVFLLISSALSSYSGALRMKAIRGAQTGQTYAEVMKSIGRAQETMFAVANIFAIVSSASTLISAIYDLIGKRERTWLDYYQLSMGLFMLVNVSLKPITLRKVFETEQMQHLNRIQENLKSQEAKDQMAEMSKNQAATSDQKAYMIRNLNRIKDPTEFFELIKKTGSTVGFKADGLTVNDKIDIPPEAYSEIGNAVFADKMNQITKHGAGVLHEKLVEQFSRLVPEDQRKAFEKGLEDIEKLPADQRKAAMKRHVNKFCNGANPSEKAFDDAWKAADDGFKSDVKKQIDKAVNGLSQGSNDPGQKQDFEKVHKLMTKQAEGTITPEEQKQLQEQIQKCSHHRKEYFFKSSAAHRGDANYQQMMDDMEKTVAGGKNLEEWKLELNGLDTNRKDGKINQTQYDEAKKSIDKGMAQAKHFREFRDETDAYVHSDNPKTQKEIEKHVNDSLRSTDANAKPEGGSSKKKPDTIKVNGDTLKQTFVKNAEANLDQARASGDQTAINDATEKLKVAKQVESNFQGNVIDVNREFREDITSFTNGQNERLCYRIDVEQVKNNLQHIYERPNLGDISVSGKKMFANMNIGEYDRLNRVLKQYGPNAKDMMIAATNVANDSKFLGKVTTPQDMAAVTEAIEAFKKSLPGKGPETCARDLATGTGETYQKFLSDFNTRIEAVDKLDPSIRSQWPGTLTMAYHWWKHEGDFKNSNTSTATATIEQYFIEYANGLFTANNVSVTGHTQTGVVRQTYMRSFGGRVHVGFRVGEKGIRASHFAKPDTR